MQSVKKQYSDAKTRIYTYASSEVVCGEGESRDYVRCMRD